VTVTESPAAKPTPAGATAPSTEGKSRGSRPQTLLEVKRRKENEEAHRALAEGIGIIVGEMGPRQRKEVSRLLAERAAFASEKGARVLLRLAVYVAPS
jgi:hypothetical protein